MNSQPKTLAQLKAAQWMDKVIKSDPDLAFDVRNDIPLPPARQPAQKYPFAKLVVGGSFAVARGKEQSVRTSAHKYGQRTGKVFTVRRLTADGKDYRCWRLK